MRTLLLFALSTMTMLCAVAQPIARTDVRALGAKGDGRADDTAAIQRAIDAAGSAGGGMAYVPAGDYAIRPIELRSGVTLYLEAGATLVASPNLADYPQESVRRYGESERVGLVTVRDARHVTLAGHGVIEGNGMRFVDPSRVKTLRDGDPKFTRQGADFMHPRYGVDDGPWVPAPDRPGNLLRVMNSEDVEITGITVRNSPAWTVEIYQSSNINIHHARIHSQEDRLRVPNDDGIDINGGRQVHISDMDIETGDDCIALFTGENITIANSTLRTKSSGVRVGYFEGALRNVVVSNLVIREANRGVNVNVRLGNTIENVLFSNLVIHTRLFTGQWWGKGEPIQVTAFNGPRSKLPPGFIRELRFEQISAEGEAGIAVYAEQPGMIRGLEFNSVHLTVNGGSALQSSYGGNFDFRGDVPVERAIASHDIPALFAHGVDGLSLRDFRVEWQAATAGYFTHAVQIEDSKQVEVLRLHGRAAHEGLNALQLDRCEMVEASTSSVAPR